MPLRPHLDHLARDVSFTLRQLSRARSFAITAVITLAIGVGVTSAVFSVVEAVLLRPLPFADPDRVVSLHPTRDGTPIAVASNLELAAWRSMPRVFDAVAGVVSGTSFTLLRGDVPEVVTGGMVTSPYLRVLGVSPEAGRGFSPADDQPDAPHVVLLSHRFWMREFQGQLSALGQPLRLNGDLYTVIGVMPPSLDYTATTDAFWVPLALSSTDLTDFKRRYLQILGRLSPGTSVARSSIAIASAEAALAASNAAWGKGYSAEVQVYANDIVGNLRSRLFILLGAVVFVFFIACVNVTNLLLARGQSRAREFAIRAALGAGRSAIFSQLLIECAVLCLGAGLLGVGMAYGLVRGLLALSPAGVPRIDQARIDAGVLLFTLLALAVCAVIVGLLPAIRASGRSPQKSLRGSGNGIAENRSRERARAVLVASEVALAMTLLSGAALLIRTAWEISRVSPGFDPRNVLTARVVLPQSRYADLPSGVRAYHAIRDAVSRTPGVTAGALTSSVPLGGGVQSGVGAEGRPMTDGERLIGELRLVTPGYFHALGIPLSSGRDFVTSDDESSVKVAVINEALARLLWPRQPALGKRIEGMDPSHQHFMTVVGIVADPRDISLAQPAAPEFYIPFEQTPPLLWGGLGGSLTIVARTVAAPLAMKDAIRRAVDSVDPSLPLANISTMDDLVRTTEATAHFNTLLLSLLGAIALILSSVGVYGVVAYSVSQRTREIGLRMALGATPSAIGTLIVRRGLAPVAIGAVIGGLMSVATTRLLREQLYNVAPGDPVTLVAIATLLIVVSLVAAYLPTRRAMRVSPVTALAG